MGVTSDPSYDTLAAELTAAMLRFDIERLPRNTLALPPEAPGRLGEVAYVFLMRQELIRDAELVAHLQALAKPVILAALAQKGMIAVWWPTGLDGRAGRGWAHSLANQQRAIASHLGNLGLADDEPILLETTTQTLLFPAAAFRRWGDTYGVHICWTLTDSQGDRRARARLNLLRGDGGVTPGHSCVRLD
jgi:hypothetical protein